MYTFENDKKIVKVGLARTKLINGTAERPYLNVKCSFDYIYAQIIDGKKGVTYWVKVQYKDFEGGVDYIEDAKKTGAGIARMALAAGITKVFLVGANKPFSQGALKLLQAARKAGLKF